MREGSAGGRAPRSTGRLLSKLTTESQGKIGRTYRLLNLYGKQFPAADASEHMSFLTPVHLQDASRILRGLALVAARAAAERGADYGSRVLRRAGEGDIRSATREALKAASQQSSQVAEVLDAASCEQTGASLSQHLQSGRQAVESVTGVFTDRFQGAANEDQEAVNSVFSGGNHSLDQALRDSSQSLEAVFRQGQQAADSVWKQAEGSLRSAVDGGSQVAESAMREGQLAAEGSSQSTTASVQGVQETITNAVAEASGPQSLGAVPGRLLWLNYAHGSGTVTGSAPLARGAHGSGIIPGGVPLATELPASAAGSNAPSGGAMYAQPSGSSLQTAAADAPVAAQGSTTPPPQIEESSETAQWDTTGLPTQAPEAVRTPAQSATDTLQSQSDAAEATSLRSHASGAHQDAATLAEQERILSQQERSASGPQKEQVREKKEEVRRKLRERRVPSSPIGRVAGFAQLGASLVYGTISDSVSSYFGGGQQQQGGANRYLTERNAERLADALCRMRGAALKLGQMISIQDENVLPPQLSAALERVRAGADVMPRKQLHKVLQAELGPDWRSKVANFEDEPLAAASIGQVHGATLHDGRRVAMKIQYPGVARSIESDVDNLMRIISLANILPKGMYIENAAQVAKRELKLECNYEYEARCQVRFQELISQDPDFASIMNVPSIIPELCSSSVLTSEYVPGVHIDKVAEMSQPVRDAVGTLLLQLTLRELFQWRFMQTDPNWGNFLYDQAAGKLHLIDFGAAREFPIKFVDDYLSMVRACAEKDRQAVIDYSTRLGFLTGDESKVMLDAHSNAGFVVGTPFANEGVYDFAQHGSLTRQVSELGAVMLRHRLTPPPEDSYSLHRKLSGAFLACIKLRAKVPCRQLFYDAYDNHQWGHAGVTVDDLPDLHVASG